MHSKQIVLLTASSGLGKTTVGPRCVESARSHGLGVGGLLLLPMFHRGIKAAITLHDIGTGQERVLDRSNHGGSGPCVGIWTCEPAAVAWGRQVSASLAPCDLPVID